MRDLRHQRIWNPEFRDRAHRWGILDGYDIPTRYPNRLPDSIPARVYTEHAAGETVALAREIVEFVRAQLYPKK